jgi:hypothetical protein
MKWAAALQEPNFEPTRMKGLGIVNERLVWSRLTIVVCLVNQRKELAC